MTEWTTIEKLVADYERDPAMAEHLRAARRKLAPILYPEGGKRYERMMRGLGPVDREPPHCPTCDCDCECSGVPQTQPQLENNDE